MTENHSFPITPPPELVQQWVAEIWHEGTPVQVALSDEHIATRAAQWGADQAKADIERERQEAADLELEACIRRQALLYGNRAADDLRAARRPELSHLHLKEQALDDLDALQADLANYGMGFKTTNIRRAIESIPESSQ